jgi:hypothetical protein
MAVAAHET